MHRFLVFPSDGSRAPSIHGAYLVGAEGVPIRGDVRLSGLTIECEARSPEPFGLSLLWPVSDFGAVQLETTRLPAVEEPYLLPVELARHRLMRISVKREEWGLFDYGGMEPIAEQLDRARDRFIEALQRSDEPQEAARLGAEALAESMQAGDRMCAFHAGVFLGRRQQSGGFSRAYLGAGVCPTLADGINPRLTEVLHFARLPFVWREIQPREHGSQFDALDACIRACTRAGLGLRGGPLLNFGVQFLPDWMYLWENDHEAIAHFAREHVRGCVQRYAGQISHWVVASGLHAAGVFSFTLEQIVELTRMAVGVAKQSAPRVHACVELVQPWGEYCARSPWTVPPLTYAELLLQGGVALDSFGLQLLFGLDSDGFRLRDMLQIATLIDRLANLGKPIHITGVAVPCAPDHQSGGGYWREPWSLQTQADWLEEFVRLTLSRPYVESVCIQCLTDGVDCGVPGAGLMSADFQPKPIYTRLAQLRRRLEEPHG